MAEKQNPGVFDFVIKTEKNAIPLHSKLAKLAKDKDQKKPSGRSRKTRNPTW